ncbi:gamma-glutamyltransferase [Microbacterium allomyrinae]|uniref:Gamma-glutamyltransferase n=1 Tax=Microbacterium allomyrinae TaxID=2830666 RepID=A0A9X1LVN0_9MICO|nr:gamma-glutamyltransferase [Microbacterium allomyrinae]MCC2032498.1 gamma-glutamyltransferase [Microbacterium allomyrinae]
MTIALAAPHPEAIAAGRRAAAAGGNALDAALAAAVMLTVVYPHQCALGGDLIALVRSPAGETTAIIAAGTAPAGIAEAAATWTEVPRQGAHSVTVPGMVAGWRSIAARGARNGLAPAFADAAAVAESGTPVSAGLARALASRADAVLADAGMRGVFAAAGAPLVAGEVLRQPALAETMLALADDADDFYRGSIARSLVSTLRAAGGTHTIADFAGYESEAGAALTRTIGEQTWHVAPPPSVGAVLIGVVTAAGDGTGSVPTGPQLVDAAIRGVHARAAALGDPRSAPVDLDVLLDLAVEAVAPPFAEPRPLGDTAAVTALDDDGWGVTIVQSVYQTFGSGLLDPDTGILLHNRGSAFSMDPDSPAVLRPGARPPHTLCPAIVEAPGVTVVAGCQGGRAQAWILSQILPDAVDPTQDLRAILARPRWVVGDRDLGQDVLTLVAEPGVASDVIARAEARGLPVVRFAGPADEAGHVQIVRLSHRVPGSASDPRADGIGTLIDDADSAAEASAT